MTWYITRQRYFNGDLGVELSDGIASDGMLSKRYPDEFAMFDKMLDAIDAMVRIKRAWEVDTDEPIGLYNVEVHAFGNRWNVKHSIDSLRQLANSEAAKPVCAECGCGLPHTPYRLWADDHSRKLTPDCCSSTCIDNFIEKACAAYQAAKTSGI